MSKMGEGYKNQYQKKGTKLNDHHEIEYHNMEEGL